MEWFKSEKIKHEKIDEVKELQEFLLFKNNRKRKVENISPQLKHFKNLSTKRKKVITQLKFQIAQLKGETKRQRSCKICRKAAGVCTRRGKPGHLESLQEEDDGDDV